VDIDYLMSLIIKEKPQITRAKLYEMIKEKIAEFGNLIDEEAAILIIARELGVKIPSSDVFKVSKLNICDIIPGLRNIDLIGTVIKIDPVKKFKRGEKEKKIWKIAIADKTGSITLTLWNDEIDYLIGKIKLGTVLAIRKAISKKYRRAVEISLGKDGTVEVMPSSDKFPDYKGLIPKDFVGQDITVLVKRVKYLNRNSDKILYIRGLDLNGNIVNLYIPYVIDQRSEDIKDGDFIFLQNVCLSKTKHNYLLIKYTPYSFFFKVNIEDNAIKEKLNKKYEETSKLLKMDLDISGEVVYVEPYRMGKCFLYIRQYNLVFPLIAGRDILGNLTEILFSNVTVESVDLTELKAIKVYRTNPWSSLLVNKKNTIETEGIYKRTMIIDDDSLGKNWEVRGAILRSEIKCDVTGNQAMVALRFILDTGLNRLIAVSNNYGVFESITGIQVNELMKKEYSRETIFSILDFVKDEIKGQEIIARGMLMKDEANERYVMILRENILPINISSEYEYLLRCMQELR